VNLAPVLCITINVYKSDYFNLQHWKEKSIEGLLFLGSTQFSFLPAKILQKWSRPVVSNVNTRVSTNVTTVATVLQHFFAHEREPHEIFKFGFNLSHKNCLIGINIWKLWSKRVMKHFITHGYFIIFKTV